VEWIGALPDEIQESSGLLVFDAMLATHNDSDNSPELYFLDSVSLEIRKRVRISNAVNTDWEDMAQDEDYIYIGDIGNNTGSRRDLKILKISKSEIASSETLKADIISFSYEDQKEFRSTPNSDWDAEALYAGRDSLWIFTKQWQSQGTAVYAIPKTPGAHRAVRKANLEVAGLITGACAMVDPSGILLSGYSRQLQPFVVFLQVQDDHKGPGFKTENMQVAIAFAQAEGIAASENGSVFLSAEAFSNRLITLPAGVYKFSMDSLGSEENPENKSGNTPE
jgi:hypothetical protein